MARLDDVSSELDALWIVDDELESSLIYSQVCSSSTFCYGLQNCGFIQLGLRLNVEEGRFEKLELGKCLMLQSWLLQNVDIKIRNVYIKIIFVL